MRSSSSIRPSGPRKVVARRASNDFRRETSPFPAAATGIPIVPTVVSPRSRATRVRYRSSIRRRSTDRSSVIAFAPGKCGQSRLYRPGEGARRLPSTTARSETDPGGGMALGKRRRERPSRCPRIKSSMTFSTPGTPETAQVFQGCHPPHPAAGHFPAACQAHDQDAKPMSGKRHEAELQRGSPESIRRPGHSTVIPRMPRLELLGSVTDTSVLPAGTR